MGLDDRPRRPPPGRPDLAFFLSAHTLATIKEGFPLGAGLVLLQNASGSGEIPGRSALNGRKQTVDLRSLPNAIEVLAGIMHQRSVCRVDLRLG